MSNLFPFDNGLRGFNHMRGIAAAEYIRRNFSNRNNCSASVAYNRACIRDAIAAIRCCNAMGV